MDSATQNRKTTYHRVMSVVMTIIMAGCYDMGSAMHQLVVVTGMGHDVLSSLTLIIPALWRMWPLLPRADPHGHNMSHLAN